MTGICAHHDLPTYSTIRFGSKVTVTRIEAVNNDQWLVIFRQSMGYGAQTVVRGSFEHVVAGIRDAWKEGEAVTSLAHTGRMWVAVLSEGANEKDQSFVLAQSIDELKAAIKARGIVAGTYHVAGRSSLIPAVPRNRITMKVKANSLPRRPPASQ